MINLTSKIAVGDLVLIGDDLFTVVALNFSYGHAVVEKEPRQMKIPFEDLEKTIQVIWTKKA